MDRHISNMGDPLITETEVKNQIRKMKPGKAPSLELIKPELYQYLIDNEPMIDND